ncbi:MAG: hypothetical protein MJ106_00310 [Lentisphaeria bacterium]|nr:hypothetical protein [Lentisphaeria bacterium]
MKAKDNCIVERTENTLIVKVTKSDAQLIFPKLALNPIECNTFTYTYRAKGNVDRMGELFYAHEGERFNEGSMWRLPAIICDGEWHTVNLIGTSLVQVWTWFGGETITDLRFDPTDSADCEIEFSEIGFRYQERAIMKAKKLPPLKPVKATLDAPAWEPIEPGLWELPVPKAVVDYAYFKCKLISSPEDKEGHGKHTRFNMRGEFMLKEKPVLAMVQFTGDDSCHCVVNGNYVGYFGNWREVGVEEVTNLLHEGKNVLGLSYTNKDNVGGCLCELFVRYADGSSEHINTDGSFVSAPYGTVPDTWASEDYDASSWAKVVAHNPPPNPPWRAALPYFDFESQTLQKQKSGFIFDATDTADDAKALDSVVAGSVVKVVMDFDGKAPTAPFIGKLRLVKEDGILWEEEREFTLDEIVAIDDNSWSLRFKYELPMYLSSNDCTLTILSGIFNKHPKMPFSIRQIDSAPGFETKPVFKVVDNGGTPVFSLNGKIVYPAWGGVQRNNRPDHLPIHNKGVVDIATLYVQYTNIWQKPDVFRPYDYDMQAEAYRRCNPDAYFVVDLQCYAPSGWDKLHPEEMCMDGKGKINHDGGRLNTSFASENYLEDTLDYLEKALDYLEHSPYANRIIGYRITGGHTLEWLGWDPTDTSTTVDFSPACQKAFEAYAKKHYPELKEWSVPTLEEREQLDNDEILWNQRKHLKAVAYADFYSDSVVNPMLALCRRAREILGNDKVIGLYYGYTMTLGASGMAQPRAHFTLKKVLDTMDGTIDFIISPHPYGLRNIGDIMGDMKPFSTMQMHGVIPVIEDDSRTFTCAAPSGTPIGLGYFQMFNEHTTVEVLRRNMADTLCRNYQYYFYNLTGGTEFDFPQAEKDIATLRAVGQFCIDKKIPRKAEVALVASEETIKAMPMLSKAQRSGELSQKYLIDGSVETREYSNRVFTSDALENNYIRFARAGAAMDYLLAEDLADNPGDYKLYVFLNCIKYDDDFLKAVEKLRERNCTMLWLYAPGYYYGLDNGVDFMERLTGMTLKKSDGPVMPAVTFADGTVMGTQRVRRDPMFFVEDNDAVALGTYEDGTIGLALKRTGNATTIFSGIWQFNVPFLNRVLKEAGVHVFSDTSDPVDANAALFTLHARFPGRKHISLPYKTDVVDIFNRKFVGKDIDSFEYDAPLHETRFFYYGEDAQELLDKLNTLE